MRLRALLTIATTVALALSGAAVAHATQPGIGASNYDGCQDRSAPTTVSYQPVAVGFLMVTRLSECDTAELLDRLRGGAASAFVCAAMGDAYRNHPQVQLKTPKSKWAVIVPVVCGLLGASWGAQAWKFSSANKNRCGLVISNIAGIRLFGGTGSNPWWSVFIGGEWVEGQSCPPGVKSDEDNPGPRSPLDPTGDEDGRFTDKKLDFTVLGGTWKVTANQNKVAYSEFEIADNGEVRATKVASAGCGVVDRGEVMGVFEDDGSHLLAGCGGGAPTYARTWEMDDWSTLRILPSGVTLTRIG